MPKPTSFAEAVPAVVDLAGKQYDLVHGDADTLVETDNGPVPSAAKALADLNAEYAAADAIAVTALARADAQAAAASALTASQQAAASAHGYLNTGAALADAGLAIGASFSVPLADGSFQAYIKTSSSVVTAIGLPFLTTATPMGANMLADAFNESSAQSQFFGNWNWYRSGVPTFTTTSANLPVTTPVAQSTAANSILKYWKLSETGIRTGDQVRMVVYAWWQNAGGRVTLFFNDASGSAIGAAIVANATNAGINTVPILGTVPAGCVDVLVRLDNPTTPSAVEWAWTGASLAPVTPSFSRGYPSKTYRDADTIGPNILFDSFNEHSAVDNMFAEQQWFTGVLPSFTTASANIPLTTPVAQSSGTTAIDKLHNFAATTLKAGDLAVFALQTYFAAAGAVVTVYFRTSASVVLGSMAVSVGKAGLQVVYIPVTVPAGAIDHVLIRVVHTVAASSFEVGGYFCAVGQKPAMTRSAASRTYMAQALVAPNILFDAYNEFSAGNANFGGWSKWWNGVAQTFSTASANIPVTTPVLQGPAGGIVDKIYEYSTLGLKAGDTVTIGVLAYFATAGAKLSLIYRDANGNVLANLIQPYALAAGLQTAYYTTTVPAGAIAQFDIRVTAIAGSAFEVGGYFCGIGQKPSRTTASCPAKYFGLAKRLRNLMPDPFFRLAAGSVPDVDGHVVSDGTFSIVTTSNSPFRSKKALLLPTGASNASRYISLKRLGLRVGDKLTVKWGLYGSQSVNCSFYLRDIAGTAISDTSNAVAALPAAGGYLDVVKTITLTQTHIDNADLLQQRVLVGQVSTTDLYVCGVGIYVNDVDAVLEDDSFADEEAIQLTYRARRYRDGEQYLRETRFRLTKLDLGIPTQFVAAAMGDSWTHLADRWTGPLATYLTGKFGDAGPGYVGFGSGGAGFDNGNVRPSMYVYARTGTWDTSGYVTSVTPGIGSAKSSTAGSTLSVSGVAGPALSKANLFYTNTADGVAQYRWNGGDWTQFTTQGTVGSLGILNMSTNMPAIGAAFTLDVQVVSGSVDMGGVDLQSAASGVRYHKLGATGTRAQQWAATCSQAAWQQAFAALGVNYLNVMFATNDQNQYQPSVYAGYLRTILSSVRAASPLTDLKITMPCENQRANAIAMSRYSAAARDVAAEFHTAFMDLQYLYGDKAIDYANVADNPNGRNLFTTIASDGGIHPNVATNGGLPIMDAERRFLLYA